MFKFIKKLLLIILIANSNVAYTADRQSDNSMSLEAIAKRLEPVGKVTIAGADAPEVTQTKPMPLTPFTGKRIYESICSDCHATGEVRSPRFGSANAWKPRTAKGYEVLYEHALNGFNFMPPKGTCDECSDEEIKAAVRYMVEQSIK